MVSAKMVLRRVCTGKVLPDLGSVSKNGVERCFTQKDLRGSDWHLDKPRHGAQKVLVLWEGLYIYIIYIYGTPPPKTYIFAFFTGMYSVFGIFGDLFF